MLIVPAALMGAAVIDRIHHTDAWLYVRYPIGILALLTIYVQLAINFIHVAPDPSEASWSHHMLLYWTDPATTMLAEQEFSHAERAVTDRGTVFLAEPNPVERWYLREMKPADSVANGDMVVFPATAEKQPNLLESSEFTLDEKWNPNSAGLTPESGIRYFFTQRAWSEVSGTEVRVDVRGQTPATPAPSASPVPSASPSVSESPAPSASSTPTPTPKATSTPTAEPTISAMPPPSPMPTPLSSPVPTAVP